MAITVHKEMPDVALTKEEFKKRYWQRFYDPAFGALTAEIDRIAEVAWQAYDESRKSPYTHPAGPGFADPDYALSDDWRLASQKIQEAERRQKDAASTSHILLINGASRSEHTCPGESSKTWRLAMIAHEIFGQEAGSKPRSWISAASRPSTAARSILARPASRPRCRSATGRAHAIPTTRSARCTIG
jgi:hypothetical protein